MGPVRKFLPALALAGVMAVGLGTAGLEAQGKGKGKGGKGGDGTEAICAYLEAILAYEYVSPEVQAVALALWNYYECGS